jgi:large conductance mechanosensitive channel
MRNLIKEFKEFILNGDIISLSTGFIIANAFTQLISSFTSVFLTPLITLATNGIAFQDLSFTIFQTQFFYGRFINSLIIFLLTGLVLFLLLKAYNKLRASMNLGSVSKAEGTDDLLIDIRNILRSQQKK